MDSPKRLCPVCNEERELTAFANSFGETRKNVCRRCWATRERAQLRYRLLELFGFKCACCGADQPEFLSLDHKNNDGAAHRKNLADHQIVRLVLSLPDPHKDYQLLCMNCNFAKGHYGVCPHQSGLSPQESLLQLKERTQGFGRQFVSGVTTTEERALDLLTKLPQDEQLRILERLVNAKPKS